MNNNNNNNNNNMNNNNNNTYNNSNISINTITYTCAAGLNRLFWRSEGEECGWKSAAVVVVGGRNFNFEKNAL